MSDELRDLAESQRLASKGIWRLLSSTIDPEVELRCAALESLGEVATLVGRIYDVFGAGLSSGEGDEVSLSLAGLLEMRGLAPHAMQRLAELANGGESDWALTASIILLRRGASEPRSWETLKGVVIAGDERPSLHVLRALADHPWQIPAHFAEALRAASKSSSPSVAPSLALARFVAGDPPKTLTDLLLISLMSAEEDVLLDCFFVMQRIFEFEDSVDPLVTGEVRRIAQLTGYPAKLAESFLNRRGPMDRRSR